MNRTKLGLFTLAALFSLVGLARILGGGSTLGISKTFIFDFGKTQSSKQLENIVNAKLRGSEGSFAVYIESMATDSAKPKQKYALNEVEPFPAASLYKLVLLSAIIKEVENNTLHYDDKITSTKTKLREAFGGLDFGYEEATEKITYTVDEALTRVGRISDNFAAIMLTEKLKSLPSDKLLIQMTRELGMERTNFETDPTSTTASDIAAFFKLLYLGKVVSPGVSEKIIYYLSLSNINNRIPAGVPEGVRVVHKTGELSRIRHDAGIVYIEGNPYVIVLLSKDLKYEDDGVKVFAEISKAVYEYFSASGPAGN